MKATQQLHDPGQSLWLDNITRELLTSGTLKRYIDTLSVTGLTSNPTIFDQAISKSGAYDQDIRALTKSGQPREDLFFKLAIADLQRAADLFRPIHERTAGVVLTIAFGAALARYLLPRGRQHALLTSDVIAAVGRLHLDRIPASGVTIGSWDYFPGWRAADADHLAIGRAVALA